MSQVVTELVIDANTSGADQFTDAMSRAGSAAQQGISSISGLSLTAAGVGAAFIASIEAIKNANKELADMASMADRVGLSLKDMQGIQLGGAIAGLTDSQVNQGLEKSAQLLNDAQRNANSLSKEFEANGLSIRNVNGQLITESQLLQTAADLVSHARNPQDAIAIAQMLGFTKEWIPLLSQGAGAMAQLGDKAKDAGAIIEDETVQRAIDFDQKWRASSANFSAYMKSALYEFLPLVDDLLEKAVKFAKAFDRTAIQTASDSSFQQFNEATGIPDSGVIKIDAEKLKEGLHEWQDSPIFSLDTWINFGRALGQGFSFMTQEQASGSVPGYAASQITEPSYPSADKMDAAFKKYWQAKDAAQDAAQDASDTFSKVAAKDQLNDQVDRAINTLVRHTETILADAKAVGLGDAALAGFRATAIETAAVQANQGKETDAQAAAFAKARDAAIAAADAFAKAKVVSQIDFNSKTQFLSAEDVNVATQLKGIYGNDIPKALDSTYASAIRTNSAFKEISTALETNLASGLTDIVTGTKSVSQGFADMGTAIVRALDQAIIKLLIVEPLMRTMQSLAGGLGIGVPAVGTAASPFYGPIAPSAHGNVFSGGDIMAFASGGIVDSPTLAPMALFGEAGPEAIVPLKRGADGNLGVSSSSAPVHISVILNETAAGGGGVSQKTNSNGGIDLEVAIAQITAKSAASPGAPLNRVLTDQLGARQRLATR